jgi:hypothetical protein
MHLFDKTGMKFGFLTIIKPHGFTELLITKTLKKDRHRTYLCKCDCGNEVVRVGKRLSQGIKVTCDDRNCKTRFRLLKQGLING